MSTPESTSRDGLILVVGNVNDWRRSGRILPQDTDLHFIDYTELDRPVLERFNPDIVLAPLVGAGFDALDLAARLQAFEFTGRLRVLCPKLPRPEMVTAELHAQAPDIDCDLLQITQPSPLRAI